ncbi:MULTISPECIES: FAD-binding protein [unclassified Streptomyces]|uniref:FAD-binding oxidoreductase n=1 Tax=unclassified Streptomyces TaxID=2593676 RepID=UPI00081D5844|nr:FAD-binding protein [Streptomyces sp. SID4917]SCF65971.1 FAD/FMN-containing dehydrogenase [Streptomyces sp. MnatMP-M17]
MRLVASTEQVRDAVQQAADAGKRLTVRGGGHCYEDFAFNNAVETVIDLSEMSSVRHDEQRGAFEVEAGATLTDVYERLYKAYGVVVPGGVCYSVGVGGHVSGGGWGMLCRRDGLIVDHLYAVEVVVVDAQRRARVVIATREPDDPYRELWWAHTGGGGGNFGVVTRYWFRSPGATGTAPGSLLPRPPAEVLLSAVSWPWEEMTQQAVTPLVRNYGAWHEAHAAAGGPYDGLVANLSLSHRSNGQIGLLTQMDATLPDARGLFDAFLRAVSDGVGVPHGAATNAMGEHGPMPEFATPRRLPWLQATRYLGVTNSVLVDPTLRGDHKSAYVRRNRSGIPWTTLYYGENYPRLQRVKAAWDPTDFFRHGQSVRLPGA